MKTFSILAAIALLVTACGEENNRTTSQADRTQTIFNELATASGEADEGLEKAAEVTSEAIEEAQEDIAEAVESAGETSEAEFEELESSAGEIVQ